MSDTRESANYKVGQDNIQLFGLDIHNPVFVISGLTIVAFVLYTLMFKEAAADAFGSLQAMAIATGFPFAIVLVGMCYATYKGLSAENKRIAAS